MHLDHVSYAAEPDGLLATAQRLSDALGIEALPGGNHPRFGTRTMVLPLAGDRYVEVVEALEHPASYQQPFGQAVRARSELGGGWLGWVVSVDDIKPVEARLGRSAAEGHRRLPNGEELSWLQIGVKGMMSDPQLPFLITWLSPAEQRPSQMAPSSVQMTRLDIAGSPQRVRDWLDLQEGQYWEPESVDIEFVGPHGAPGLVAVSFVTSSGPVTI